MNGFKKVEDVSRETPRSDVHRRMLDLLAGWMQYTALCAESSGPRGDEVSEGEYEAEMDEIHDLYQEVGKAEDLSEEEARAKLETVWKILMTGRHS